MEGEGEEGDPLGEGKTSGVTGSHRLCQRLNEGACGRVHLVVELHSKSGFFLILFQLRLIAVTGSRLPR